MTSDGGGDIAISARNIRLGENFLDGTSLLAGIKSSGSTGSQAGNITLDATGAIAAVSTYISNTVYGVGNPGDINFKAGSLSLSGTMVNTSNFTEGRGGDINIRAGSLSLKDSRLETNTSDRGNAGNVSIKVDDFVFLSDSLINSEAYFGTTSNSGDIRIEAKSLSLTNQSFMTTATSGTGNAGSIVVQTSNAVLLDTSFISSNVNYAAVGDGGDIRINAGSLSLLNSFINNNIEGHGKGW